MIRRILGLDEFTGWHMLGVLTLFFGTIIAVNLTLAVLSTRSWTGLVVQNSYVASQHFDDAVAAREAQAAMGWETRLDHADGRLVFRLADAAGRALRGAEVVVDLGRPTHEAEDHRVKLAPTADGYGAAVALDHGFWDADVHVEMADGRGWDGRWRLWVETAE